MKFEIFFYNFLVGYNLSDELTALLELTKIRLHKAAKNTLYPILVNEIMLLSRT